MEIDNLLLSMQRALENSKHSNSQELFQKIVDMAAKKLCNQKNQNYIKLSRKISRIRQQNKVKKIKNYALKKKKISKRKLKLMIMRKITKSNKRIHEGFIQNRQQQSLKKQKHQLFGKGPSMQFKFEEQEYKFEQVTQKGLHKINEDSIHKQRLLIKRTRPFKVCLDQKYKKTRRNFDKYLESRSKESIAQEITCPICIDILIDPVSTLCGHSFCFKCLDQSLLFGSNCPVCRLPIKGLQIMPCQYLKKFIQIKSRQFLDDQQILQSYRIRKEQRNEWKRSRIVDKDEVQQGFIIDVRDTQNIWCKARVAKIYYLNNKISSILVHYLQWAKLYDEVIQIKSTRLAPKDHFSSRTDLPRYNLNSQEQNLRGAVVTGNNNDIQRYDGLNFSNIIHSDNLRDSINSIRNNIGSLRNQAIASQVNHRMIDFFAIRNRINSLNNQGNRVNQLHNHINFDSEFSNQDQSDMYELSQSPAQSAIALNEAQSNPEHNFIDQISSLVLFQPRSASQEIRDSGPQYIVINEDQESEQYEDHQGITQNERSRQDQIQNQGISDYSDYDLSPFGQNRPQVPSQNNSRQQQSSNNGHGYPSESGNQWFNR